MVTLILLACAAPASPDERVDELLASDDAAQRMRGFVLLDRAEMVNRVETLISMAQSDPDPVLRDEVVRQLGYTRDPRVLPVLDGILADPDHGWKPATGWYTRYAAIESYAYYGGQEGCRRFAEQLHDMPRDEHGSVIDHRWYTELVSRAEHCSHALEPYAATDREIALTLESRRQSCCTPGWKAPCQGEGCKSLEADLPTSPEAP